MDILHGLITDNVWAWAIVATLAILIIAVLIMLALVLVQLNKECDLRGLEGLNYEIDGKSDNHGVGNSGYRVGDSHSSSAEARHGEISAPQRQERGYPRAGRTQSRRSEAL